MNPIARRLAFAWSATGFGNGAFTPFFGAWLAYRGLDAAQIGVLTAASMLLRVAVMPVTGLIADARNDRRGVMVFLYALAFMGYAALNFALAPDLIFIAAIVAALANGAALPLLESVSVRLSQHFGFDYGHVRLAASSLFIAGNILSGFAVAQMGLGVIAPWLALALFLNLIAVWILPRGKQGAAHSFGQGFRAIASEAKELLRSKVFVIFLIAASLTQGSHAFYYTYGGLHWQRLGYSGTLIGIIWPLGVFVEIGFLVYSKKLFAMLGAGKLLLLGALASLLRWTMMAFDPPFSLVIFAQFLHGATFVLAHLGAMYFIAGAVPSRLAATAQSLYAVCWSGLAMGLGSLASGFLYERLGGQTYFLMAAMAAGAAIASLILTRIWHGRHLTREVGPEIYDAI
jgi:PPP family 3-phenylpropionic acid transporter